MGHQNIIDLLDQHFLEHQQEKKITGIAYGLIKDGQLIHSKGFGETVLNSNNCPNESSVFRIASMIVTMCCSSLPSESFRPGVSIMIALSAGDCVPSH